MSRIGKKPITLPSGVKVFNWLCTMYQGNISLETPMLYAFNASSEDVVASTGTSSFCSVASDSPSSPRSLDDASPRASSTFSLETAVTCSSVSVSPL